MADKISSKDDRKGKPSASNDQLGENSGSGRLERAVNNNGKKCK